jgi:hypothetical protein
MNNKQMGNIVADMFAAQIEKINNPEEIVLPPLPPQEVVGMNAPGMPTEMPFQQEPYTSTLQPAPEPMPPMAPQFNEPPPLDAEMQAQLPAFTSMPQEMPIPGYNEDPSGASSLRNPIIPVPNAY